MRIPVLTLAALAGVAQASPITHQISGVNPQSPLGDALVIATATFDISGISSYDEQGDPDNMVMNEFLAFAVKTAGCFIENNDFRVFDYRPGQSYTLELHPTHVNSL